MGNGWALRGVCVEGVVDLRRTGCLRLLDKSVFSDLRFPAFNLK